MGYLKDKKMTTPLEALQPGKWFAELRGEWQKAIDEWRNKPKAEKTEGDNEDVNPSDVLAVENVCDVGEGRALFEKFAFEDWALAQIRYELLLMALVFKKDVA